MTAATAAKAMRASRACLTAAFASTFICGLIVPVAPAQAQAQAPAGTRGPSEICQVFAVEAGEDLRKELRASCHGRGLILGPVTSFEATLNEDLKATLVDARLGAEQRVLLLTMQDDGTPLVEDLTGQVALEAGRGPMSAIDGVTLDLKTFAQTGEIGIQAPSQGRATARAGRISLGPQIAAERARRQAAASEVQ